MLFDQYILSNQRISSIMNQHPESQKVRKPESQKAKNQKVSGATFISDVFLFEFWILLLIRGHYVANLRGQSQTLYQQFITYATPSWVIRYLVGSPPKSEIFSWTQPSASWMSLSPWFPDTLKVIFFTQHRKMLRKKSLRHLILLKVSVFFTFLSIFRCISISYQLPLSVDEWLGGPVGEW